MAITRSRGRVQRRVQHFDEDGVPDRASAKAAERMLALLENEGVDTSVIRDCVPGGSMRTRLLTEWLKSLDIDPNADPDDDEDMDEDFDEVPRSPGDARTSHGRVASGLEAFHKNREPNQHYMTEADKRLYAEFRKNRAGLAQFGIHKFSEFKRSRRRVERRQRPAAPAKFSEVGTASELIQLYERNRAGLRAMGVTSFSEFCKNYALGSN